MKSTHRRWLRGAVAVPVVLVVVAGVVQAQPAAASSTLGRLGPLRVLDVERPMPVTSAAVAAATTTVPTWTRSVKDGTSTFSSTMVGKNPLVHQTTPSTTVATKLVPLVIRFSNGDSWDPTAGDSCDTTPAVTRITKSPLFQSRAWTFGSTAVGTGQYVDAYQRANFWTTTKPGGLNPGYHVKLSATVLPKMVVNVPDSAAAEGGISCGSGKFAGVDIDWLDNYLRTQAIPALAAKGVTVTTFPLFVVGNVVEYIGTTANCCVLGFHSATQRATGIQTYGISMYDNIGFGTNGAKMDIATMSHEIAEWMDDPLVNNTTKPWGHTGQVSGCQNNLENGDPLSGTTKAVALNGKTYHVQELAFASWFYHQRPSTGVNGWYSNYGKFTAPAAACS